MDRFWLVWCPEGRKPPKYQHNIKESAEREAARLAEKYPGEEFYVMEAISMAGFWKSCTCCPAKLRWEDAINA